MGKCADHADGDTSPVNFFFDFRFDILRIFAVDCGLQRLEIRCQTYRSPEAAADRLPVACPRAES